MLQARMRKKTMAETLRVGILGAGGAGTAHAVAFSRLPDVNVTALCSRTRTRAEALAGQLGQPGIQVYDGWQDLMVVGMDQYFEAIEKFVLANRSPS